jgi:hypothetical protein
MHIINQDESTGIVARETTDTARAREELSDLLLLPG